MATLLFESPQKFLKETSPACRASEGQNSTSYQKGLSFHTTVYKCCFGVPFLTTAHLQFTKFNVYKYLMYINQISDRLAILQTRRFADLQLGWLG